MGPSVTKNIYSISTLEVLWFLLWTVGLNMKPRCCRGCIQFTFVLLKYSRPEDVVVWMGAKYKLPIPDPDAPPDHQTQELEPFTMSFVPEKMTCFWSMLTFGVFTL